MIFEETFTLNNGVKIPKLCAAAVWKEKNYLSHPRLQPSIRIMKARRLPSMRPLRRWDWIILT